MNPARTTLTLNSSELELINTRIMPLKTHPLRGDRHAVQLDRDTMERLLDALSDLLATEGLNEDDTPNAFGLQLERLIDLIARLYYTDT